jgi:hypothetical protein
MIARLRLAITRLADAERERIWAIVAAKEAGLSIRQIARAIDVSPTRIHQLLQAHEIPVWLRQLQDHRLAHGVEPSGETIPPQRSGQTHLADEVEVLRWCLAWLERLEQDAHVVVHLRPVSAETTEFVPFDRPRVLRVLTRIAADLDALTQSALASTAAVQQENPDVRHRRRLAEPEVPPRRLSRQEERAALRQAAGLPPYTRR